MMQDYHCRACGGFLFSSDASWGRLRVVCQNRLRAPSGEPRRRCHTSQVVFLGGKRQRLRIFPTALAREA